MSKKEAVFDENANQDHRELITELLSTGMAGQGPEFDPQKLEDDVNEYLKDAIAQISAEGSNTLPMRMKIVPSKEKPERFHALLSVSIDFEINKKTIDEWEGQ